MHLRWQCWIELGRRGQNCKTQRRRAPLLNDPNFRNHRSGRSFAAALQHFSYAPGSTREQGLDRAITPVTDPAVQPQRSSGAFGPGAVCNTLHASRYKHTHRTPFVVLFSIHIGIHNCAASIGAGLRHNRVALDCLSGERVRWHSAGLQGYAGKGICHGMKKGFNLGANAIALTEPDRVVIAYTNFSGFIL